jgi:dTDP-4-amino-4,6-dideoxygalactose transaminase
MKNDKVQFNKPHLTGRELANIAKAHDQGMLAGDGDFTRQCHHWLEGKTSSARVLLTHSCTAALEMSALLLDIQPGDEIIMPSFTFVSTANAFVLRGGIPVFIDIHNDTQNMDERLVEAAITDNTRAIVPVHYAGIACEMNSLIDIANRYNLAIIEDAAQGIMSSYHGQALGSIGDFGCYSFHETKNIISGEGGALLINDSELISRAEIIREKGTDRSLFFRGEVEKYSWQEVGSSYLPGELIAAFLWAQLEEAESITKTRLTRWEYYHEALAELEHEGKLQRPSVPNGVQHNGHMYYILLSKKANRKLVLQKLSLLGIDCVSHYVPLHSSPAGKKYARTHGTMAITNANAARLIRLPIWAGITFEQQSRVVMALHQVIYSL